MKICQKLSKMPILNSGKIFEKISFFFCRKIWPLKPHVILQSHLQNDVSFFKSNYCPPNAQMTCCFCQNDMSFHTDYGRPSVKKTTCCFLLGKEKTNMSFRVVFFLINGFFDPFCKPNDPFHDLVQIQSFTHQNE